MESEINYQKSAEAINDNKLVVYPTETVYGLGANALNAECVYRVFDVKSRDRSKPISFAASSIKKFEDYINVSDKERKFMNRFLPGAVTVLCEKSDEVPDVLTSGNEKVGVRIPDHPVTLRFLDYLDIPITSTSANKSGTGSVKNPTNLNDSVKDNVSQIINIGTLSEGVESTVVDVDNEIIHRSGAIPDAVNNWFNSNL